MPNKKVRDVAPKSIFESAKAVTSSSVSYAQGDLLIFDSTTHTIIKPSLEADLAKFLGIAKVAVSNGKLVNPYVTDVDASQAISDIPGPEYGTVWKLVLKTGDALNPGDFVYGDPASGTRNVQAVGTKAIGVYQGPAIASAVAGQEIEVLIGARFPNDALAF